MLEIVILSCLGEWRLLRLTIEPLINEAMIRIPVNTEHQMALVLKLFGFLILGILLTWARPASKLLSSSNPFSRKALFSTLILVLLIFVVNSLEQFSYSLLYFECKKIAAANAASGKNHNQQIFTPKHIIAENAKEPINAHHAIFFFFSASFVRFWTSASILISFSGMSQSIMRLPLAKHDALNCLPLWVNWTS